MEKTPNDLIHIGKPIEMDVQEFFKQLEVLAAYGYANREKIRDIVAAIVPTYHSADSDLKLHKKVYENTLKARIIYSQYGPADFQEGKTHHNWYLFEDKIDSATAVI